MTDLKQFTPDKIVWLDLEMTGLNPVQDRILEVAMIITDWDFQELAVFESGVGQNPDEIRPLLDANSFFAAYPENKQHFLELSQNSPTERVVQDQIITLVNQHIKPGEKVLLGGNSIHTDRQFIRQWWPKFEERLHYRMLDVSAWKVLMMGKFAVTFEKQEKHRALGDIRETIAEIQYYLHWFGREKP